jgi:hypothetical protein
MFVTSTSEVADPGISYLLLVLDDQLEDEAQVLIAEAVVPGQFDLRLDPELRLAVGGSVSAYGS